jgi:hypothetical protein
MTKVFIAGSRQLSRLDADVKRRIDTMIFQRVVNLKRPSPSSSASPSVELVQESADEVPTGER